MTIRHLKKYLFFSVTAIKMMYFLAFIKEFETHIHIHGPIALQT